MRAIFLACYSPNAMKGIIAGSDRTAAVEALLASAGGKLESLIFTRGEFDVAVTVDMPDQSTGMGLTMAINASGAFTRVSVLEELDMEPIIAVAQKAMKVFEPAG
jgi:uncharacterized protein with GYD domain